MRLLAAASGIAVATLATAAWRWAHAPRIWEPRQVSVAFWSWRAEAPAREELERASRETGARVLFMRAGQLDFDTGRVARVRAFKGSAPTNVELHLVYNATPALLAEFERIDEGALADAAVETFRADSARASKDGASVAGLQLDIDAPTRLLARYGRVLHAVRDSLPTGARLSVTGLPTWMNAGASLREMLGAVDFWVPQFYGALVPASPERLAPIASPAEVRRASERAREVGKPFYAGLAAYGYALVYTEQGKLVELSGDLDPARVAADRSFELIERRAFSNAAPREGEWRYVYRAREDASVGGVFVRAGERIVLDAPSGESLRASARGVRETAGDSLLGICVFRLPTRGDATTLSLAQIAAALEDREAEASARVTLARARASESAGSSTNQLLVEASNDGAVASLYGEGAFTLTLRVPRGSLRGVTSLEGFDTFETLCESRADAERDGLRQPSHGDANQSSTEAASQTSLRPCGAARATFVRLGARAWGLGALARAGLSFEGESPARVPASVVVRRDDGGEWSGAFDLGAKESEGR